jgi:hypothetical protein
MDAHHTSIFKKEKFCLGRAYRKIIGLLTQA